MKIVPTVCVSCILFILLFTIRLSSFGQTEKQQKLELLRLQLENKFVSISEFDTTSFIATYSLNGEYGYIDTAGNKLKINTSEKIYSFFSFINGFALIGTIVDNKKSIYIIDKNGKVLQKLHDIDDVRDWSNIDRIVAKNTFGKHGVVNRKGEIVVPFIYYLLERIDSSHLRAYVGEKSKFKVGVIDFKGRVVIPATHDQLYYFNNIASYLLVCDGKDLLAFQKGRRHIAKNAFPQYIPEPGNLHIDFSNGLILNKTHHVDILYDLKLDTIKTITQKSDNIDFISSGLVGVSNWLTKEYDTSGRITKASGLEFSILTKEGAIVKQKFFGEASEFVEGMSRVTEMKDNSGYIGFMNQNCLITIPCIYQKATDFKNGFAKVQKGGKYFLIDKEGNFIMDIMPF